ncbi:MAG TPA: oxygenase MpaB family protein, partial [Polyangiaceae bacterium]
MTQPVDVAIAARASLDSSSLPTDAELRGAIARAQVALGKIHGTRGPQWSARASLEPIATAETMIVRAWVGQPSVAAESMARRLVTRQRPDGSFQAYPNDTETNSVDDLCATALVWAALAVAPDFPGRQDAIAKAQGFVESRGGLARVLGGMDNLNFAAVFVAMSGILAPSTLPDVSGALALLPGILRDALGTRLTVYAMEATMMVGAIIAHLKGRHGIVQWLEDHRALEMVQGFQNPNGDWDAETTQTVLMLAFYHAAAVDHRDPKFTKAIAWLDGMEEPREAPPAARSWVCEFHSGVWSTSFALHALFSSGASRRDARITETLRFLLESQVEQEQARIDNLHLGAPRSGGWAMQKGNVGMPDCDDTGIALMALGHALRGTGENTIDPALVVPIRAAIQKGEAWVRGMQDPCGGWGAFAWGFKDKKPGPIMTKEAHVSGFGLAGAMRTLLDPPWVLQDSPTEDVTARVLLGLGSIGFTKDDPAVAKAIAFLRKQQCADARGEGHGFWGRWVVNYLASTAFVLMGLSEVGEDMKADWIQRAIAWVKSCQRADGSWGESQASYAHPELAGQGPSMPPLTGLVTAALLRAGEKDSPEVAKAIRYLLTTQASDGTWPNGHWLHVYFPPNFFYDLPIEGVYQPLQALAFYAEARGIGQAAPDAAAVSNPRLEGGSWNAAYLASKRSAADPVADAVVAQIFQDAGHLGAVNELLATIVRSDDPIPAGLPDLAQRYFAETAALPPWADPAKIRMAEATFTRIGWTVTVGLYCCALPRAYCAGKGAKVLLQTGGMTEHTMRRVFETAQFVLDVMNEGGLGPEGRGVRAAQKVRLLHASIRHLVSLKGWDEAADGKPINQEDEVGTLMTFSWAIVHTWHVMGIDVSAEEVEAWIHTWNVIGALMGIEDELLPKSAADARALADAVMGSQWESSAAGQALGKALVAAVNQITPHEFAGYFPTLIRYLAGDLCGDLLGLAPADWTSGIIKGAVDLTDV